MSDERTQTPSKQRRRQARERGLVARSPELTAAVGLLAAVVLLGAWGDDLAGALVGRVRAALEWTPGAANGREEIAAMVREAARDVAVPLLAILGGVALAMIATHQVQVGGLWVPGLLAPDPTRLRSGGAGGGLGTRGGRGAWGLLRAGVLIAAVAWTIQGDLARLDRLATLGPQHLARAAGGLLVDLARSLALACLALGLADFASQWRRVEAQLRQTPEEQREEQRTDDGDPALRARRRRMAESWRRDPTDLLPGSSLVLAGPGLAVLLAGDPPPGRIQVRATVRGGPSVMAIRRAARRAGVAVAESPSLALHLARGPSVAGPLPPGLASELVAAWPRAEGGGRSVESSRA